MQPDGDHLRQQAERARRWAEATFDKQDRDRLERIAQDYEHMADAAEEQDRAPPTHRLVSRYFPDAL